MHAFSVPGHTNRADYSVNNNNNQLIAAISRVSQKIRSRYIRMGKTNSYMCIAGKSVIKNCENNYLHGQLTMRLTVNTHRCLSGCSVKYLL